MNLVLDDAEEMSIKKKSRKPLGERLLPEHTLGGRVRVPQRRLHVRLPRSLTTPRGALAGRILLKGDNITLMMNATPPAA